MIDPIASLLQRLETNLLWILEHGTTCERHLATDVGLAQKELAHLEYCSEQALAYFDELAELLLNGKGIDGTNQVPNGLGSGILRRKRLREERIMGRGKDVSGHP